MLLLCVYLKCAVIQLQSARERASEPLPNLMNVSDCINCKLRGKTTVVCHVRIAAWWHVQEIEQGTTPFVSTGEHGRNDHDHTA
jgi:hypothetical protein